MAGRRTHLTRRRGSLLTETTVAAAIASVAIAGVVQLMFVAHGQMRMREHHALMVRETANVMEDLFSRPWDQIVTPNPLDVPVPEALRQVLPGAKLQVDIQPEAEREQTVRITVRVAMPPDSKAAGGPVQLVAWRERNEEAKP